MLRVLIDPGHGLPFDGGASANGLIESELVFDLGEDLEAELLKIPGISVTKTREVRLLRTRLTLEARGAIGIGDDSDVVISLHGNAMSKVVEVVGEDGEFVKVEVDDPKPHGLMTFHKPGDEIGLAMCRTIEAAEPPALAKKTLPIEVNETTWRRARNVLAAYKVPAILVEVGFLTNPDDARALKDAAVRRQIVAALVAGVLAAAARLYTPVPKP